MPITPPDAATCAAAIERSNGLAKPVGSLGRLEELGAWIASCQGVCPPEPLDRVRAVILAGDHGVVTSGVSAYPKEVTVAMVRAFVAGIAAMNVLARQHGAQVRVLDIGVDDDLDGVPASVKAHKLTRGCGAIDVEDALTPSMTRAALEEGRAIAAEEVEAGAQLLILGDMGIGNTTPSAALIASSLGLTAEQVTGAGTGLDAHGVAGKTELIARALARVGDQVSDPISRLAALGSADLAAGVGFLAGAAELGVPVLLDGVICLAEALVAEEYAPGAKAWWRAGHRSTEPAQQFALDALGLTPILDLGMRLGEGSGAMAAVPMVRSGVAILRDMALLSDLMG